MIYQNFETYADSVALLRGLRNHRCGAFAAPLPGLQDNAGRRALAAFAS